MAFSCRGLFELVPPVVEFSLVRPRPSLNRSQKNFIISRCTYAALYIGFKVVVIHKRKLPTSDLFSYFKTKRALTFIISGFLDKWSQFASFG